MSLPRRSFCNLGGKSGRMGRSHGSAIGTPAHRMRWGVNRTVGLCTPGTGRRPEYVVSILTMKDQKKFCAIDERQLNHGEGWRTTHHS